MPAINIWLGVLIHRFSSPHNIPRPDENVWNSFPFNNATFCELAGLADTTVGLSQPPIGPIGEQITQANRDLWDEKAAGGVRFLRWLDNEMRVHFQEKAKEREAEKKAKKVKKASKKEAEKAKKAKAKKAKADVKGKGKAKDTEPSDESSSGSSLIDVAPHDGPRLDLFQTGWKRNASTSNFNAWTWLLSNTLGLPGGVYNQLRDLMKQYHCDAETAHRIERERIIKLCTQQDKIFRESNVKIRTAFESYWTQGAKSISLNLFGRSIVKHGVVDQEKQRVVKAICNRLFENDARHVRRVIEGVKPLEKDLKSLYEAALVTFTAQGFRQMSRLLGRILTVQRICGVDITEDKGTWKDRFEKLLREHGRIILPNGNIKKDTPTSRHLVPEHVMDQAVADYAMMLRSKQAIVVEEVQDMPSMAEAGVNDDLEVPIGPDAGVLAWGKKTLEDIWALIGIENGHVFGRPDNLDKSPMWHQWVAVIEMVKRTFTNELGKEGDPTLLADQVGLGKTITVILYIQVLWHLQELQKTNPNWPEIGDDPGHKYWPKVLGDCKYYMGKERIPDEPILIVLPRTIARQWRRTMNEWLAYGSFNCFEFGGSEVERESFFKSKEYRSAIAKNRSHTIILAHNPSISKEGRRCLYETTDRSAANPCDPIDEHYHDSVFNRDWLLGVVDEAHIYRNCGLAADALITLMSRCAQRLALTATPLFTHPRNLLQLGRILRISSFIGTEGIALVKHVNSCLAEEAKAWKKDKEHKDLRSFLHDLRKQSIGPASEEALSEHLEDFILSRRGAIQSFRAFWTSRTIIQELLRDFDKVLIRRDERSKDVKGEPLLSLFPKHAVISWLALGKRMKETLADQTLTNEKIEEGHADLQGFFTRVKQLLVHPDLQPLLDEVARIREEKKRAKQRKSAGSESGSEPEPEQGKSAESDTERLDTDVDNFAKALFPDLQAYLANPSEKIDRTIEICEHHLGEENKDNPPLAWRVDGSRMNSLFVPRENDCNLPRRKVVIYCHMAASWALTKRVLELKGFKTAAVNGHMSQKARDDACKAFQSDDPTSPEIMLLSDVGLVGLNLQRGSVCVFMDHPWSASEQVQIEGRVQRHGQLRQVYIYRIVAPDTADEFLLGYANGKMLMMQVFARVCELDGRDFNEVFEDEDDEDEADHKGSDDDQPVPAKSKVTLRKPKAQPDPPNPVESEEEAPPPRAKPKPRLRPPPEAGPSRPPTSAPASSAPPTPPVPAPSTVPARAPVPTTSAPPAPIADDSPPLSDPDQWDVKPGKIGDNQYHPAYPQLGPKPAQKGTKGAWSKSVYEAIKVRRKERKARNVKQPATKGETARAATSDAEMQELPRRPIVYVKGTPSQPPATQSTEIPATNPDPDYFARESIDAYMATQSAERLSQELGTLGLTQEPVVGDKRPHPSSSPDRQLLSSSPVMPPSAQPPRPFEDVTNEALDAMMDALTNNVAQQACSTDIGGASGPKPKRRR